MDDDEEWKKTLHELLEMRRWSLERMVEKCQAIIIFWRKKERKVWSAQVNERVKWGGEAGEETNERQEKSKWLSPFSSFLFWSRLWSSTLIQLFFPPFASTSSRQDVENRADERTRKWWWFFFAAAFSSNISTIASRRNFSSSFSFLFFSLQLVNVESNHAPAPLRWRLRSLNCRLLLRVLSFLFFGGKFLKFAQSYTLQAFECLLCCPLENKSFFVLNEIKIPAPITWEGVLHVRSGGQIWQGRWRNSEFQIYKDFKWERRLVEMHKMKSLVTPSKLVRVSFKNFFSSLFCKERKSQSWTWNTFAFALFHHRGWSTNFRSCTQIEWFLLFSSTNNLICLICENLENREVLSNFFFVHSCHVR